MKLRKQVLSLIMSGCILIGMIPDMRLVEENRNTNPVILMNQKDISVKKNTKSAILENDTKISEETTTVTDGIEKTPPVNLSMVPELIDEENNKMKERIGKSYKAGVMPSFDPSDTARISVSIQVRKDGEVWTDHGKQLALGCTDENGDTSYYTDSDNGTDWEEEDLTDGIIPVMNGYYKVYEVLDTDEYGAVSVAADTGVGVIVHSSNVSDSSNLVTAVLDYYTVSFYDSTDILATPASTVVLSGNAVARPSEEPVKTNYNFVKWVVAEGSDIEFDFVNTTINTTTKIYAKWEQKQVSYTAEYFFQNIADDNYPSSASSDEILSGSAGDAAPETAKTFTGFTAIEADSAIIKEDNSTVVKYYYTRNKYTLTWDANGGSIQDSNYITSAVKCHNI